MYLVLALKETLPLVVAIIIGFIHRKVLVGGWRVVFIQAFISFVFVLIAYIVTFCQYLFQRPYNNQWVYNIAMLAEAYLLIYGAYLFLKEKVRFGFLLVLGIQFILVYVIQLALTSFFAFANYAYVALAINVVLLFSGVCYFGFKENKGSLFRLPELYLCTGLVLYFAAVVPYLSLFSHLQRYFPYLNMRLFDSFVGVSASLRYLLLATSFYVIKIEHQGNSKC